jgi:uncharacterized protein YxjI
MPLGRERREERREERRGGGATRYQMREKVFSIGDDLWIEADGNRRAFKVNGKALRLRRTLIIEDPSGRELAKIQDRPVRVRDVMEIEDATGGPGAHVKKAMITPLRERFTVDFEGRGEWKVQGNILDHEYEIEGDGRKIAEVSRKWFRVRDTYGIEVQPGQNDAMVLAVVVCLDEMTRS